MSTRDDESNESTPRLQVQVSVGDVLDHAADVLISTANPWLNMSGGVNGTILARNGQCIQAELRDYLARKGRKAVEAGTVVRTGAGTLPFQYILHAVAIDPFYDSDVELVRRTIRSCFQTAQSLGARTLSMPTLATGYGPLSVDLFAEAMAPLMTEDFSPLKYVQIVVRSDDAVATLRDTLET